VFIAQSVPTVRVCCQYTNSCAGFRTSAREVRLQRGRERAVDVQASAGHVRCLDWNTGRDKVHLMEPTDGRASLAPATRTVPLKRPLVGANNAARPAASAPALGRRFRSQREVRQLLWSNQVIGSDQPADGCPAGVQRDDRNP
jgi:hypothetical protein